MWKEVLWYGTKIENCLNIEAWQWKLIRTLKFKEILEGNILGVFHRFDTETEVSASGRVMTKQTFEAVSFLNRKFLLRLQLMCSFIAMSSITTNKCLNILK